LGEREITLAATEAALDKLAEKGYDPDMGARPLRRVIQIEIEDQLSDDLLSGKFKDGDTVWVDVDKDGNFCLKHSEHETPEAPEPVALEM
jgi:ATP-dependent Clp protease ATP-binding subunit ClpC